jgi:hypothetical protein
MPIVDSVAARASIRTGAGAFEQIRGQNLYGLVQVFSRRLDSESGSGQKCLILANEPAKGIEPSYADWEAANVAVALGRHFGRFGHGFRNPVHPIEVGKPARRDRRSLIGMCDLIGIASSVRALPLFQGLGA